VGHRLEWTFAENLASTGIRSPGRPARSEPIHVLRLPGPCGRNSYLTPYSKLTIWLMFCRLWFIVGRLLLRIWNRILNNISEMFFDSLGPSIRNINLLVPELFF
jgi:hypothetical protein